MQPINEMSQSIEKIKQIFTEKSKELMKKSPNLKAVFCIGSAANEKIFTSTDYQDFDIHFYYDKSFLSKKDLDEIKGIFNFVKSEVETDDVALDYCIKDKPWKMVARKKMNIGIHGTVLNKLDFLKRTNDNYIMAANMFANSEVLVGNLNYPKRKISNTEFLSSAGGIGWLKENFYKLVNILDPNVPALANPIKEIAIYFGLTPLIHYYYLKNSKTTNRKTAHEFFEKQELVPEEVKQAVNFIYASKKNKEANVNDSFKLLEASHIILNYVSSQFEYVNKPKLENNNVANDEYSRILTKLLGRNISISQNLIYFKNGSFKSVLKEIKTKGKSFSNVTPDEYFETVNFLVNNSNVNECSRLYFFENNDLRSIDKTDFSPISADNFIFSWEKGLATYIQRLNEIYLNSTSISNNDVLLSRIFATIVYHKFCNIFNENVFTNDYVNLILEQNSITPNEEQFFENLNFLSLVGEKALSKISNLNLDKNTPML